MEEFFASKGCEIKVLEGFDRIGKDNLLAYLKDKYANSKDVYVYIQHHEEKPSYRENPRAFTEWMQGYIRNQVDELKNIKKMGYKGIWMCRLLLSDMVYCKMFNREPVVEKFIDEILSEFDVHNVLFLFKDFNEYKARLASIGDSNLEYSEEEFNNVNKLYRSISEDIACKYSIPTVTREIKNDDWLKDILHV